MNIMSGFVVTIPFKKNAKCKFEKSKKDFDEYSERFCRNNILQKQITTSNNSIIIT